MKLTISLIKADVGSIAGHTRPSSRMIEHAINCINQGINSKKIIDGFVFFTGDDIALLMTHKKGENNEEIHQFAWNIFKESADIAKEHGLYGAGQDLLADAPSGNIRGAGPGVAEIEFELGRLEERKAEPFLVFAADKCGPGAYNLPLFLAFADPMYCAGLMLPQMIKGFKFRIIDMENKKGESIIEFNCPEDYYKVAILLRDNERFGIQAVYSRTYGEKVVAVSAQRLHSIAGKYVGKDDPVAIVRTQTIFPAPEEVISPYMLAHYVGGDSRGSHVMPLMPVKINTPVTGPYCLPIVSCIGFSIAKNGSFSEEHVDFFGSEAWEIVRQKAQKKAVEIRKQGWSGAAMLPYSELEYSGYKDIIEELISSFDLI